MKSEEDEAFDELARKQGSWGGGFKAKQDMAMHKTQDQHICRHYKQWQHCYICDLEAQVEELKAQEPVAYVTGVYGGRFTYAPLNPAMVLPVGMSLYAGPQREQNFCSRCGKRTNDIHTCTPPQEGT